MSGVYLIYRNRLFRDAVAAILTAQPEIKLLGATDQPDRAAPEIAALAPSVILLEEVEDGPAMRDVHYILTSMTTAPSTRSGRQRDPISA